MTPLEQRCLVALRYASECMHGAGCIDCSSFGDGRVELCDIHSCINELAAAPHTAAPAADRAVSELAGDFVEHSHPQFGAGYFCTPDVFARIEVGAPPADRAELAKEAKEVILRLTGDSTCKLRGCLVVAKPALDAIDALARSTDAPSEPIKPIDLLRLRAELRGRAHQRTDAEVHHLAERAGFKWIDPDDDDDGFPGGFDMSDFANMRKLVDSLTSECQQCRGEGCTEEGDSEVGSVLMTCEHCSGSGRSVFAIPPAAAQSTSLRHPDGSINVAAIGCGTPPAAATSTKWAMSEAEYDRMVNGLMAQLGEISEALEISEEDQSCANGNDAILAAIEDLKQPAAATSTPCASGEAIAFTGEHVSYVQRFGGRCRDCADENGVCPSSGLPCGGREKAIRHVLNALSYGLTNKFISSPLAATQAPVVPATLDDETIWRLFDAIDFSNKTTREAAVEFGRSILARTPTASNTEDARNLDSAVALATGKPAGAYTTQWQVGGPLLDEYSIDLRHHDDGTVDAFVRFDSYRKAHATGGDSLEAAMCALVKCFAIPPLTQAASTGGKS